jgi:hypothetical protein
MDKQATIGEEKKGKGDLVARLDHYSEVSREQLKPHLFRIGDVVQCVNRKYKEIYFEFGKVTNLRHKLARSP